MTPTEEQSRAIDLFKTGESLRIDAYAGTGKTTTLRMIAESSRRRGHYLAFSRAIADEAKKRFPWSVRPTTNHGLAFRWAQAQRRYSTEKLTTAANANLIAEALRLNDQSIRFGDVTVRVDRRAYGAILKDACRNFLYSADAEPQGCHVPRWGLLADLGPDDFQMFATAAAPKLQELWGNMQDAGGRIPLGHDGYLKLWALTEPRIDADFILLDEAQDSNPVIVQVLNRQQGQIVFVGDPYQQIYEWRGAINAMEQVATKHRACLSQSFRFGEHIAAVASRIIRALGARENLRGLPSIKSEVCPVWPKAILCRTNMGLFSHLMMQHAVGRRCHVLGGTVELQRLLQDVERLKTSRPAVSAEFFGFSCWAELLAYSLRPEGRHTRALVKLVKEYGEQSLLHEVHITAQSEADSEVTLSTAHKAKGREWSTVLLAEDFELRLTKLGRETNPEVLQQMEADARVVYVAATRAIEAVELPPAIMADLRLQIASNQRLGTPPPAPVDPVARHLAAAIATTRDRVASRQQQATNPPEG
jgi:AAA domain/UvrD-like helicase C-terminal domain